MIERIILLSKIAVRNVFRNRRRTILTLFILILGCNGLILVGGFFDNIMGGLREQFIHSQTGHLQVNVKGFHQKGASSPFKYLMKDVSQVKQTIESTPDVLYAVPRLRFGGMTSSDETSIAVMVLGVDAERERQMGNVKYRDAKHPSIHIAEGRDLDSKKPYDAVLGKGLLEALGLRVGDRVTLITTREAGALDGAEYYIRGSFETIFKDFDDRAMKINLASAQQLLGIPDQVHNLLVVLNKTENTKKVHDGLVSQFRTKNLGLEILTWEELGSFYRLSKELFNKIYLTIQIIISVIFFFSIANTINMALFERMREFGTMMALGNSRTMISTTIMLEVLILGLIGSVLGVVSGFAVAYVVSIIGIEMPPPPMGTQGYYAMISVHPQLLIETFSITLISTLLSAIVPAYRVSQYRIVDALGYV